ncbi:MAG: DoxX family protein [Streptomyces sp.]
MLTPPAATGLALVMVPAAIIHARREEPGAIAFNAVLLILAAAVAAWSRFGPYSFCPPIHGRHGRHGVGMGRVR